MTTVDNFALEVMNDSMLNRYSGISWYLYLKHKLNHSSISNLYLFLFLFLFLKLFHLFIFQILSPPGPPVQNSSLHTPPIYFWGDVLPLLSYAHPTRPWAFPFSGSLVLYWTRCILSHWGQIRQSSATYILEAMDQPGTSLVGSLVSGSS